MLVISGFLLTALAAAALAASAAPRSGRASPGPRQPPDRGHPAVGLPFLHAVPDRVGSRHAHRDHLVPETAGGGWEWAALAVFLAQGLLPFLALLWPRVKRSRRGLAAVCVLLLAAHLLESWWLVLPGFDATGMTWFAPAATLAIGGLSAALFLWRLDAGRPDAGVRHG